MGQACGTVQPLRDSVKIAAVALAGTFMSKALPWIKIGISASLLAWIAFQVDWQTLLAHFRGANKLDLVACLVFLMGAYLVNGIRLAAIQRRLNLHIPRALFWGSYYSGLSFNYVLPSGIGGDTVRVLLINRKGYPAGALIVSALADRFYGLIGLFGLGGLAILAAPSALPLPVGSGLILGAGLILVMAAGLIWFPGLFSHVLNRMGRRLKGRWGQGVEGGSGKFKKIFAGSGPRLSAIGLSLLSHLLVVFSYAVCGRSLLPDMGLCHYLIAVPGVMLILLLPISLGGLGLREVSTVGLLVWMGADPQAALAMSLVYLAISWASVAPGIPATVHLGLSMRTIKELQHDA